MGKGDVTEEQLRELTVLGRQFAEAAEPLLVAALERATEGLAVANAERLDGLNEESREAFRRAVTAAIRQGAGDAARSVADEEVWLEPSVNPDQGPERRLDHPANRAWIRLTKGAAPLDPVMGEFGLAPSATPDPGGGHYGLQPRSAAELDPRGALTRLWEMYWRTYRRIAEDEREGLRGRTLRWWRRG
jgi:hypothetical protein